MSGGSTGSRAAVSSVSSQDAFKGQFDSNMLSQQLIGGKMKLRQFSTFQQALSNAMSKYCMYFSEDVKASNGQPRDAG